MLFIECQYTFFMLRFCTMYSTYIFPFMTWEKLQFIIFVYIQLLFVQKICTFFVVFFYTIALFFPYVLFFPNQCNYFALKMLSIFLSSYYGFLFTIYMYVIQTRIRLKKVFTAPEIVDPFKICIYFEHVNILCVPCGETQVFFPITQLIIYDTHD